MLPVPILFLASLLLQSSLLLLAFPDAAGAHIISCVPTFAIVPAVAGIPPNVTGDHIYYFLRPYFWNRPCYSWYSLMFLVPILFLASLLLQSSLLLLAFPDVAGAHTISCVPTFAIVPAVAGTPWCCLCPYYFLRLYFYNRPRCCWQGVPVVAGVPTIACCWHLQYAFVGVTAFLHAGLSDYCYRTENYFCLRTIGISLIKVSFPRIIGYRTYKSYQFLCSHIYAVLC